MKKTIAVIGSAAALSFAGAGLAAAQSELPGLDAGSLGATETTETETDTDTIDALADDVETPAEVSEIAQQLCGTISAYDFLGSAGSVVPGLSGDECEANADAAVAAAMTGDIAGALDILRGIDAETPGEVEDGEDTDTVDAGSLSDVTGSLGGETDADADAEVDADAVA
ncbi:hypothetical protein R4P08_02750 [Rhodococcus sp. IEGM 1408]|nr:hypothetical protein [Rhodococcus sp. IEGM 1408]